MDPVRVVLQIVGVVVAALRQKGVLRVGERGAIRRERWPLERKEREVPGDDRRAPRPDCRRPAVRWSALPSGSIASCRKEMRLVLIRNGRNGR